jgi:predicted DNA-binding WGR domain protein
VRRFEFVGGISAKFWEVQQSGSVVTIRFGRIGTNGQTQTKDFPSEAAAVAHREKLIAEKVKKGYSETTGAVPPLDTPASTVPPAPPAQAGALAEPKAPAEATASKAAPAADESAALTNLPDEETFVLPAGWRRTLHPRRGGTPGPALAVPSGAGEVAALWLESRLAAVQQILGKPGSDRQIVQEAEDFLQGGGRSLLGRRRDVTPLGAAAVAGAAASATNWQHEDEVAVLADAWVAEHGLAFAAAAVTELGGLYLGAEDTHIVAWNYFHIRRLREGETSARWKVDWQAVAHRVRALLAAAPEADYQAAEDAVAPYRAGLLRQRIVTSFLFPTRTDWVEADTIAAPRQKTAGDVRLLLIGALGSRAQFDRLFQQPEPWMISRDSQILATLADGLGPSIASAMATWFDDEQRCDADSQKRIATLLAAIPTDEAFHLILERADHRYMQPAVLDAMRRFPVRALRLLAEAADGSTPAARRGGELLRAHALANPSLVAAMGPTLPPLVREQLDAIGEAAAKRAVATADMLPEALVSPPWAANRKRAKPVVVEGLEPPVGVTIAWRPGEKTEWETTPSYGLYWGGADIWKGPDWNAERSDFVAGRMLAHREPAFFCYGPERMVRPLLPRWQPQYLWNAESWVRILVGRYELDAAPLVAHVVRVKPAFAGLLAPYADARLAMPVADWFVRLKSVRPAALAWLTRHPATAAAGLIPAALGRPGKERRTAETALRAIAAAGATDEVVAAARRYGPEAAAAIEGLLETDPLDFVPARIPAPPDWLEPALLPPIRLRDSDHILPDDAIRTACTMLAISKPGDVYAGVDVLKEVCDPAGLAEFGWGLFRRWQAAGMPSKDGWVLDALGWIGDDETVRRLSPVIRAWPGEGGHTRAVQGLDVLAAIGTNVALMHLHGISQKVKFKGLRERAQQKINDLAAELGLTTEELADRLVPDLGLDDDGAMVLDYGTRRFVVGFDEQLKPYVTDEDGTRRKELPKPGARDDQAFAGPAYKRFAALKKDVRTIATDQIRRLEQAMVVGRRWTGADFADLFLHHPLLWHLVRRLVWGVYDTDGRTVGAFRVAEDRTLADSGDDTTSVASDALIGVAHPFHLADTLGAWSEIFADYEILQPFPQLGRDVYRLTDEERAANAILRFQDVKVPTVKVLGLERRGWVRGDPQDAGIQFWYERRITGGRVATLGLDPGIPAGDVNMWPEQKLTGVGITDRPTDGYLAAERSKAELDPVTASELIRDIASITT